VVGHFTRFGSVIAKGRIGLNYRSAFDRTGIRIESYRILTS